MIKNLLNTIVLTLMVPGNSCYGMEPEDIFTASKKGHVDRVRELLARGIHVDTRDASNNNTPLHWTAANGHENVAQILIAYGANVDAQAKYNDSPLHWAAGYGHDNVVQLLVAHGANVDARNEFNSTPLHEAAGCGFENIVQLLVVHGANVDAQDVCQNTPLYCAVFGGHRITAQLLIQAGASLEVQNSEGKTPAQFARARRHHILATYFETISMARSAAQNLARGQMRVFCQGIAQQGSPVSLIDGLMCQHIGQYLREEYREQALEPAQQKELIRQERACARHGKSSCLVQ